MTDRNGIPKERHRKEVQFESGGGGAGVTTIKRGYDGIWPQFGRRYPPGEVIKFPRLFIRSLMKLVLLL